MTAPCSILPYNLWLYSEDAVTTVRHPRPYSYSMGALEKLRAAGMHVTALNHAWASEVRRIRRERPDAPVISPAKAVIHVLNATVRDVSAARARVAALDITSASKPADIVAALDDAIIKYESAAYART